METKTTLRIGYSKDYFLTVIIRALIAFPFAYSFTENPSGRIFTWYVFTGILIGWKIINEKSHIRIIGSGMAFVYILFFKTILSSILGVFGIPILTLAYIFRMITCPASTKRLLEE